MGCSNLLAVFVHAASVLVAPPRAAGSLCTPNFCSNVTCKPIEASECNGKVEANATDCGCCEKCIVPLGLGAQSRHSRSVVKIGARHELEGSWPVPSSNLSTVRTLMKGRTASHRKRGIWETTAVRESCAIVQVMRPQLCELRPLVHCFGAKLRHLAWRDIVNRPLPGLFL
ncbi:uncharacterized protein [Dermacentor albipictus]